MSPTAERRPRWSLRARLTLAMVSVATVGMLIVLASTLTALPIQFRLLADTQLVRVRDALVGSAAGPSQVLATARSSFTTTGTLFVRVVDDNGRTEAQTRAQGLDGADLPAPMLPDPLPPGFASTPTTVRDPDGAVNRVLTFRLAPTGQRAVLAQSLAPNRGVSSRLALYETITVAVALAILALVTRRLLTAGLRPLRTMATTADAIASGEIEQRLTTGRRHSEIDDLARALNLAFDAREHSEQTLRRFVADASHELRTPLTTIQGWAQLQMHGLATDPETVARGVERIDREAGRMHRMVEDLLTLARLDEQRSLTTTAVDMSRLVTDVVDDLHAVHPERPLRVHAPERLFAEGDGDRLTQMLINLLGNAVTHTPPEAAITVTLHDEPPAHLVLTVADEGPGMSAETAAVAFERFSRAASTRQHGTAGAGLGLSIVQAVVHIHGGTIDLATAPGHGTRFTIHLPATH